MILEVITSEQFKTIATVLRHGYHEKLIDLHQLEVEVFGKRRHATANTSDAKAVLRAWRANGSVDRATNLVLRLTNMLSAITGYEIQHGRNILVSASANRWLLDLIDDVDSLALVYSMLMAMATAPRNLISIDEVVQIYGSAASTWRKRAATGEVAGVVNTAKAWFFDKDLMALQGFEPLTLTSKPSDPA